MEALSKVDTRKKPKGKEIDPALTSGDDNLLDSIFEDIDEHLEKISSHRWHSEKHRVEQDLHLQEYRKWLSAYLSRKDVSVKQTDGTSTCNNSRLFSSDLTIMSQKQM